MGFFQTFLIDSKVLSFNSNERRYFACPSLALAWKGYEIRAEMATEIYAPSENSFHIVVESSFPILMENRIHTLLENNFHIELA